MLDIEYVEITEELIDNYHDCPQWFKEIVISVNDNHIKQIYANYDYHYIDFCIGYYVLKARTSLMVKKEMFNKMMGIKEHDNGRN